MKRQRTPFPGKQHGAFSGNAGQHAGSSGIAEQHASSPNDSEGPDSKRRKQTAKAQASIEEHYAMLRRRLEEKQREGEEGAVTSCNAEQLATLTSKETTSIVVLDVCTSLAELKTGRRTVLIGADIQAVLSVDVQILVLVQFGCVTDSSEGLKAMYRDELHAQVQDMWIHSVGQPVELAYSIYGNTIIVTETGKLVQDLKSLMKSNKR